MEKRSRIKNLNKGYFQKSMFFLYPLLKISKKLLPLNTYVSWNNASEEQYTLICRFKKFASPVDQELEKQHLLKHPRFINYYELEDGTCIYLFTYNDAKYKNTWDEFIKGSYSKFLPSVKTEILSFYKPGTVTYDYITSYLYPADHYNDYAELLNIPVEILKGGKELIDRPDLEKETLKTAPINVDLSSLNLKN